MQIVARRVLNPLQKVRISLKNLPRDPTPEQVKQFRVQLRRTEAVLDSFGLASCHIGRRVLRYERPLRVRAGKIHDMDTFIGLATSLLARGAEQCRIELLEVAGAKRYQHARKLLKIAAKSERKLTTTLEKCESRIQKHISAKASTRDRLMMTARLAARIVETGSELAHYPRLSHANLHVFRIRIRHFRRLLRIANQNSTSFYGMLGEVKDAIGEWHDWERLAKTAHQLEGHPGYRALLAEIKAQSSKKFRRAVAISQQLRQQYLDRPWPENQLTRTKPTLAGISRLAA